MLASVTPTATAQDAAEDLAYMLRELLAVLPPLNYATAPVDLIEAVHGAVDMLKKYARVLEPVEISEWPLRCPAPFHVLGCHGQALQEAAKHKGKPNWMHANRFRTREAAIRAVEKLPTANAN